LTYTSQSRAGDVRALLGAITLGSGMGLAIGAAYLIGGLDRMSGIKAAPAAAPAMMAAAAPSASTNSPALNPSALGQVASAQVPSAAVAPVPLRARFHLPVLHPVVARPFRLAGAADNADLNCLTQAVYYEARGESQDGQRAVAQVVLNRVRHPAFPKTICGVVHQRSSVGCQFTFACSKVLADPIDDDAWRKSKTVASRALHGGVMASIGEATHFQTVRSGAFAGLLKVAQIGAHAFYRFAGRAGSDSMFHQTPAPSHGGMVTAEIQVDGKAQESGHVVVASLTPPRQQTPQTSALQVEHAAEAAVVQAKSAADKAQATPGSASDKAQAAPTKTASAA
jgi:hypothetical protein